MTTITVQADVTLLEELTEIARLKHISLEEVAKEALTWYVAREQAESSPPYSFIGIGRSGKSDLSRRVDETLAAVVERREGWSLEP